MTQANQLKKSSYSYNEHVDVTKQIRANLDEHGPLNERKAALELESLKSATEMLVPLQEYSLPAFLAIRAEIGLPIDETWYRQFTESGQTAPARNSVSG